MRRLNLNLGRGIRRIYIVFSVACLCLVVYHSWNCVFYESSEVLSRPYCPWGIGLAAERIVVIWVSVTVIRFVGKWILLGFKKDIDSED